MAADALSPTCSVVEPATRVWLWPGQALYRGPSLDLDMHSGSVACLAVGLDGPLTVRADGYEPVTARSVLIAPRLLHRLVTDSDRMVFCYLDPSSSRRRSCHDLMRSRQGGIASGHRAEPELVALGASLRADGDGLAWLDVAAPSEPGWPDPRILRATERLRTGLADGISADQLAADAGLSPSRFLHLFKEHTGTSFRRYRLWIRMLRATSRLSDGADLTTAAADAGFASPSHFSTAFHRMFGLPPSRLVAAGARVVHAGSSSPDRDYNIRTSM